MTRSYIWKIPQNPQESYRANKQIQQSFSLQDKHTKIECVYTSAMNNPKWKLKNLIYNSIQIKYLGINLTKDIKNCTAERN